MRGLDHDRVAWTTGLALVWLACRAASGFDGLYGQDPHEYLRYTSALKAWVLQGTDPGFSYWPPGYPMAAALVSLLGFSPPLATQAVSFAAWLAAFWFGSAALERLHPGARGSVYWGVLFSLSPFLMRSALSSMSDMLAIAWECAFLSFGLQWLDSSKPRALGAAFFCFGVAAATRLSAPVVLGLFAAWLLGEALRRREGRAVGAALVCGLAPLAAFLQGSSLQRMALSNAEEWAWTNMAARTFATASAGEQTYTFPNLLASFAPLMDPGFCIFGIVLLTQARRSDFTTPKTRVLLLCWLVFALFLAGFALQNDRHHLASFPIALLLLFPAFDRGAGRLKSLLSAGRRMQLAVASAIGVQLFLVGYAARPLVGAQRQEIRIAERLRKEPPVTLYAFSFTLALRNRGVPQRAVELWDTKPTDARPGDLVLFAPEALARKWRGQPLLKNFELLRLHLEPAPLADFGAGWFLYRVASRVEVDGP